MRYLLANDSAMTPATARRGRSSTPWWESKWPRSPKNRDSPKDIAKCSKSWQWRRRAAVWMICLPSGSSLRRLPISSEPNSQLYGLRPRRATTRGSRLLAFGSRTPVGGPSKVWPRGDDRHLARMADKQCAPERRSRSRRWLAKCGAAQTGHRAARPHRSLACLPICLPNCYSSAAHLRSRLMPAAAISPHAHS